MWLWCFLRQRGDAKPRIGRRPALPKFLTPTPLVGPPTPPGRVPAGAPTGWERVVAAKLVLRPRGHAGRRERGARPELDDPLSASSRLARKVGMVRSLVVAGRGTVRGGALRGWVRVVAAQLVLRPRGHAGRRERGGGRSETTRSQPSARAYVSEVPTAQAPATSDPTTPAPSRAIAPDLVVEVLPQRSTRRGTCQGSRLAGGG
jgi:hypothetical protein